MYTVTKKDILPTAQGIERMFATYQKFSFLGINLWVQINWMESNHRDWEQIVCNVANSNEWGPNHISSDYQITDVLFYCGRLFFRHAGANKYFIETNSGQLKNFFHIREIEDYIILDSVGEIHENITSDTELSFTDQLAELGSRGKLHIQKLLAAAPNNTFVLCIPDEDLEFPEELFDMPTAILKTEEGDYDQCNITRVFIKNGEIIVSGVGEYSVNVVGSIDELSDEQICFLADHLEQLSHEKDSDI